MSKVSVIEPNVRLMSPTRSLTSRNIASLRPGRPSLSSLEREPAQRKAMSGARHRTWLDWTGGCDLEAARGDQPAARGLDADPRAGADGRDCGAAALDLRGAEAVDPLRADQLRVHEEIDPPAREPTHVLDLDLELALAVRLELRLALGPRERARGLEGDDRAGVALRLHGRRGEREGRESDDREWDEDALHDLPPWVNACQRGYAGAPKGPAKPKQSLCIERSYDLSRKLGPLRALELAVQRVHAPLHNRHDDRRADVRPEAVDREVRRDPLGERQHQDVDHEVEEPERDDHEREREHRQDRLDDRVRNLEHGRAEEERPPAVDGDAVEYPV